MTLSLKQLAQDIRDLRFRQLSTADQLRQVSGFREFQVRPCARLGHCVAGVTHNVLQLPVYSSTKLCYKETPEYRDWLRVAPGRDQKGSIFSKIGTFA